MEFLDTLPPLARLFFALMLVIALMGGLAFLLKRMGFAGSQINIGTEKRLKLIEILPLDARRRLVLIQRDDKQHLVLLGANSETVIENDIKPIKSNKPKAKDA